MANVAPQKSSLLELKKLKKCRVIGYQGDEDVDLVCFADTLLVLVWDGIHKIKLNCNKGFRNLCTCAHINPYTRGDLFMPSRSQREMARELI